MEISTSYQRLIQERYDSLKKKLDLAVTDKKIYRLLLPQTIQGNIEEGHGPFYRYARPGTKIEDICQALNFNPQTIKEQRTKLCYEPFECVDALLEGTRNKLVNKKGKALFRVRFFQDYQLEVDKDLFKGAVKIGRMDSSHWRIRTALNYPKTLEGGAYSLGCGAEYLINTKRLRELNLTPLTLSKKTHSKEEIENYFRIGLFVGDEQAGSQNIENLFVRHLEGLGICDDLAISTVAAINGESAGYIGLMMDAIDTYGKWVTTSINGGIDEFLAEYIAKKWEEKYHEKLVSDEECMELIYLASKNNMKISPFSSSHRRFIQRESKLIDYTFLEHMEFIKTGHYHPFFRLGFHRTLSKQFYENLRSRFDLYGIGNLIPKGKEKIPRSKKPLLQKTKKERERNRHESDLQDHSSFLELIAMDPSLIGIKDPINELHIEMPFYKEGQIKHDTAGETDLLITTQDNTYFIEYKGRDSPHSQSKAKKQLLTATKYLEHLYENIVMLYVSGPDLKTMQLEKKLISKGYHNRNNFQWTKFP